MSAKMFVFNFVLGFFLYSSFIGGNSLPTISNNVYERHIPSDNALKFMKKYGYLMDDNGQSEAIYSEENLSNIVKKMQRFGAIQETGIVDNATLKLMTSKRCGVPDIVNNNNYNNKRHKRFSLVEGWNKRHITYYISNWSYRLGEQIVARNIQKALDIWGGYGRLTFSRSYRPDADIIVAFASGSHGDNYPFDGPGSTLAHAFFPGTDLAGDIHFDDDESWADLTNKDVEGTDFFTVALHELGHSLGLSHSDVPSSIMFPYYKGWEDNSNSNLNYDDIMGMYSLYIQRRLPDDDELQNSKPSIPDVPYSPPSTTTEVYWTTRSTTPQYREPPRREPSYPESDERTSGRRRNPWFGPRHRPTTEPPSYSPNINDTVIYEGDDEHVDVHKEHDPHHKIPKNNSPSLPYICNGHFDAVAKLRGELFIFKDEYLWRLRDKTQIYPGYPNLIRQMFPDLPETIKKIDAAYERPDGNIVLFTGNKLWIHDGITFVENSPLPLSYYQLPDYLDNIDAVQTWAKNGKTYFYKNDRFWRYNESTKTMDPGYPMHIDRWQGVPSNLDAALTWTDGVTYFFKGELFWKFNNDWISIAESSPLPIGPIWLDCKEDPARIIQLFGT